MITFLLLLGITSMLGGSLMAIKDAQNDQQKAKEEKDHQKEVLEKQKKEDLRQLDESFDIAEKEANRQADKADEATSMQEKFVTADYKASMDQMSSSQLEALFQENETQIQMERQTADELTGLSMNGTRAGSSLAQAVELEASQNAENFQTSQDMQRKRMDSAINGMIGQYLQNENMLQQHRDSASDMRNAYLEGGAAYENYQNQRTSVNNGYQLKLDEIQYQYNKFTKENWSESSLMKRALSGASGIWNFGNSLYSTANSIGLKFIGG